MLDLQLVKTWLKLEQDETTPEDVLLQMLVAAAAEYIRNATGREVDGENPLVRLLALTLVTDWYLNREAAGQVREELRPTVRSIVTQLQHAYPIEGDAP